jgi:hypothetical protein
MIAWSLRSPGVSTPSAEASSSFWAWEKPAGTRTRKENTPLFHRPIDRGPECSDRDAGA